MQISLTPLQSYNAMFKLLDSYGKKTNSDDILSLLGGMCFLIDKSTADSAMWEDWTKAIHDKKNLTKQEAFDGMIRFLEIYRECISSTDTAIIINQLCSAKDCNDMSVALVKQWNFCLNKALQEPEGTREYLMFSKE